MQNISKSGREGFWKKYKTMSLISNLITPKEPQSMSCKHMRFIELNRLVKPHFWECESLLLIYLKYSIGSLKTHSNDAIYHMLPKTLKFSASKMQYAEDNQEDFIWVTMWAKKG